MNPIDDAANKLLAKEKLGVNFTVNMSLISLYILKQELLNKKILCKSV